MKRTAASIESPSLTQTKKELVYRRAWPNEGTLRRELNEYVWWYNNERLHSTLGYMSPVEFREAGLSL